jgi:hypothetical protein
MANIEQATLILRTGDLIRNAVNQYGSCDQYSTNFIWNNINLRTLLGSMYDKYDLFNICLTNVTQANGQANFGVSDDDIIVQIYLKGLPFIHQTYSVTDCCNNDGIGTVIGIYPFSYGGYSSVNYNHFHCATFSKNQEQCNINIYYQKIYPALVNGVATYSINTANPFPEVLFKFKIYGIEKTEHQNGGRIII